MKLIKTVDAVGHILCHDITQIIKDVTKDVGFHKGHVVKEEDIPILLSIGKENLYIWEKQEGMLHEDEAAAILYQICAGESENLTPTPPKEGKIEVIANCDGLLTIDLAKLKAINSMGQMMIATRHSHFPVKKGDKLAGTRIIPLLIEKEKMDHVLSLQNGQPIVTIHPFKEKKVGIVTTGSEVFAGRIQDTFTPVLIEKIREFGGVPIAHDIVDDNHGDITCSILSMIDKGVDLVLCSGGMSVDPDDRTPLAIKNTGAHIVSYGAPVLPGAMFMLAYYTKNLSNAAETNAEINVPILGLPGCVMYAKRTIFDLILPRIFADIDVNPSDLAALGHGGLCLNCDPCTFPNCEFGKGV